MAATRATRIRHIIAEKWLLLFTDSGEYTVGTYPTRGGDSAGLGKGLPVDVEEGHMYPVEIMFSDFMCVCLTNWSTKRQNSVICWKPLKSIFLRF